MIDDVSPTMVALELSDKYGKFAIEPLERGFGQTLGSAFRRVLLAHIEGATVTDVRIDGVPHAFTTIEGLYEDATELCLNIKEIAIKYDPEIAGEEEQICRIDAHGKGEITGADVICPPGIEIDPARGLPPQAHSAQQWIGYDAMGIIQVGKEGLTPHNPTNPWNRQLFRGQVNVI